MGCTHNQAAIGTSAKAVWIDWATITFPASMTVDVPLTGSAIKTLGGNFVASITKKSTGNYRVQLTGPYPAAVVNVRGSFASPLIGTTAVICTYKAGSYVKASGYFDLFFTSQAATPVAADPGLAQELHLEFVCQRLTTIGK